MTCAQIQNLDAKLRSLPIGDSIRRFLDYLRIEAGLSENTILGYGRDLAGFARFCRLRRVESLKQVRPEVIYQYLQYMAGKRTISDTVQEAIDAIEALTRRLLEASKAAVSRFLRATKVVLTEVWSRNDKNEDCGRNDDSSTNRAMTAIKQTSRRFLNVGKASMSWFLNAARSTITRIWRKNHSGRRKSEASINRALVALKMLLRFGRLVGIIEDDFTGILEGPKPWQKLPVVFSPDDVVRLLNAPCHSDRFYLRDKAILEMLYATGVRAGELAALKIGDLNLKIGYLRCFGKGGRERVVPLGRAAIGATERYLEECRPELVNAHGGDYLFLSRTGRPMGRIEVWRLVKKYAHRAGMGGNLTVHTLRHCFATHLLAGGAGLRSVQEMLGHANIVTTQIYTHVDQDRLRKIHKEFHPRP